MEINYKPNSQKYKEEQKASSEEKKKIEKVVSGTVKVKKKSGFRKFADDFISDKASNIKSHIVEDIIIPTIKKGISSTVDLILYGRSQKDRIPGTKISYTKFYDEPRRQIDAPTPRYSYDDIIVESRGEAEAVLSQLSDIIDTYERASVADLYDLVGISGDYTDQKYGWVNVRNAEAIRVDGGYWLKLPKAIPLK